MAATQVPSPCAWGRNHRSFIESSDSVLLGGEVRWGNDATLAFKPRLCVGGKKGGRWRRTGKYCARFAFRGEAKEEDVATLMEMDSLVEGLFKLNEAANQGNQGIGPDVRSRVDVLYNRATVLKSSADSMVASGGRVPVHLTATLKALQREHVSVENIVRLAMWAGPVIIDVQDKLNPLSEGEATNALSSDDSTLSLVFKEKEERSGLLFESLTRQSSLETVAQSEIEEYLMSTPAFKDVSSLSAFQREIERRVMQQLAEKIKPTMDSGAASQEQEERLGNGDAATSESNEVLGLVQNLPLRGSLPRRRDKGAVMDEAQSGGTLYVGELDAAESQLQMLNQSSLTDTQQQSTSSIVATDTISKELEELRNALSMVEPQLSIVKEYSTRAERAETQLQQLTEGTTSKVPLDIHNQVVKLQRESMVMARTKLAQVTAELKEKEVIIDTIKQETMAERESLLVKVRELSDELSKRICAEDVETAVSNAVYELEMELRKALKRAESMRLELETNENLLRQLQQEWDAERASLCGELGNVKEQLAQLQQEQVSDRNKVMEAVEKVKELDDSLTRMQQSMMEADEERVKKERNVLATLRSLVTDMVKTKRGQAKMSSVDSRLLEATKALDTSDLNDAEAKQTQKLLDSILSEEKAMALETFFVSMGVLLQQETGKLGTTKDLSRELANCPSGSREFKYDHLDQDLGNAGSVEVDMEMLTKPIITLYYESGWEFAYLHYSVDNLGWTELPGVCMRNDIVVNNMPLKVVDVEGSSIEFVLTDGRGSWDCAPQGGNYHIKSSGTFLLSSGFIERKK